MVRLYHPLENVKVNITVPTAECSCVDIYKLLRKFQDCHILELLYILFCGHHSLARNNCKIGVSNIIFDVLD